jgi:hypothetical protein
VYGTVPQLFSNNLHASQAKKQHSLQSFALCISDSNACVREGTEVRW